MNRCTPVACISHMLSEFSDSYLSSETVVTRYCGWGRELKPLLQVQEAVTRRFKNFLSAIEKYCGCAGVKADFLDRDTSCVLKGCLPM